MGIEGFYRCAFVIMAAITSVTCASKQKIGLECVPKEVIVYVDGELLEGKPPALDLRSDRPHTLYFKGPGLVPELVVLNSEKIDGEPTLSPSEVCVKPRYVQAGRELEMEIDPDVTSRPPAGGAESRSTIDVEPRPDFFPGNR